MEIYSGNPSAIGHAVIDVTLSSMGVVSPVPGAGQALKAARVAEHGIDVVRATERVAEAGKVERTYQTYKKINPKTGEVYSGCTSGYGSQIENIINRDANHYMSGKGFGPAILDKSSYNKEAIRGREQQSIDYFGGAKSSGGDSGNAINGVSTRNPNGHKYFEEAKREFGGL